jgi:hypothetical protein
VNGHLSEAEIRAYTSGQLQPPELLSADGHLASCDACRARASRIAGLGPAVESLQSELLPIGSHLSDEEVQRLADERVAAHDLQRAKAHLSECALCARQVGDVRVLKEERSPRLTYYAAAAAVLLAVIVPALWLMSRTAPVAPRAIAGIESLPADAQAVVRAALAAGIAEPPTFLTGLPGRRESLMGGAPAPPLRVQAPVATAIATDRPTFEWTPVSGRSRYAVAVFTEDLRPVVRSPGLAGTSWTPDQPLERDRTYVWQVTAEQEGRTITVPAPPEPQAKFRVLDQQTASLLERTAAEYPTAHLLLGILYANAGVRREAETHLREVAPDDPHATVARRTLERMRAVQ